MGGEFHMKRGREFLSNVLVVLERHFKDMTLGILEGYG